MLPFCAGWACGPIHEETANATPPSLWRHRDFLKLWIGQTISVFGSQFTGVALPWIAVYTLHATAPEMGLLNALGTLPFLLFGLLVGVWVDRWPRRPILIAGDVGRGVIVLAIALLAFRGLLNIPYLYVAAFAAGVFTVFFDVAYQSYLPSLVDRGQLVDANGKLEATRAASAVAGPSIGGVIIQALSAWVAMAFDAVSFFVSGAFLAVIRKKEPAEARTPKAPILLQIREGLRVVLDDPRLRAIAKCIAMSNFFSSAMFAIFVLYAVDELLLDAAALGLVFGLGSIGTLAGALLAGRLARRFGVGRVIVTSAAGIGVAILPVLLATPATAVPLLIASQFLVGVFALAFNINQLSLRQAICPDRLQGRMNATMRFLVWGTLPPGAIVGGILGGAIGLWPTIAIAAAGVILAFLWIFFSPVRTLKEIPRPVEA